MVYVSRLFSGLSRSCTLLRTKAILAYVYLKACLYLVLTGKASLSECLTGDFRLRASHWVLKRALCFREPLRRGDDSPYDLDFIVLDHTDLDLERDSLDSSVIAQIPPEWTDWKVELRFARGDKKRRLVVRRREHVDIRKELSGRRNYVTVCALMYRSEDTPPVDVKSRFDKYVVVPHRRMYARDIFPMDDPDSFDLGCVSLSLKTACGDRFVNRLYSLVEDDDLRDSCVPPEDAYSS